jgi:hypothetical protein
VKLSEVGIEFDNKDRLLTHNDLKAALETINIEKKLILVVDEFPDVLEKINAEQGHAAAVSFLSGCRELWQDPALDQKMRFILTGSIGLDTLVNKLNLSNLINVLNTLSIAPFSEQKAIEFVDFISNDAKETIELTTPIKHYLIAKVGWLMPYYIDMLWTSLEDICCDEDIAKPTETHVDKAYEELFSQNNKTYFIHWVERLTRFAKTERKFARLLLSTIAESGQVANQVMHDLKQDPQFKDINCNYVSDCLEHDGYIFFNTAQQYQFTSPLLKDWWRQYAARNL